MIFSGVFLCQDLNTWKIPLPVNKLPAFHGCFPRRVKLGEIAHCLENELPGMTDYQELKGPQKRLDMTYE